MGRFQIRPTDTGFKFDLKAGNGEVIATSQVYATPAPCRAAIRSVIRCVQEAALLDMTQEEPVPANPRFELYRDRGGLFRFRLRSRNGRILLASQGYGGKSACEAGIASVRANAREAALEPL